MKKLTCKTLYILWAAMFLLTAVLGLLFPEASGVLKWTLTAVSVLFFVPPWMILTRAKRKGNRHHIRLIRWLALASITLTAALLVLNLRSAGYGEGLGMALNAALTIVSAPMVCSNFFVLPIFLWGTLLADTFVKK